MNDGLLVLVEDGVVDMGSELDLVGELEALESDECFINIRDGQA